MPTPTTAFADAAAKYGGVDPDDIEAVQRWFAEELPKLSTEVIEQVLHDLLSEDGRSPPREIVAIYPERASLPSLRSSPSVDLPPLADDWKRLLRRLLSRSAKRR